MVTHNNNKVREMPILVTEKSKKRFWDKVSINNNNDICWEWTKFNNKGYGTFRFGDGIYYAHRVAYFLHFGNDPLDKLVCHKCDNRKCCNPNHLFLGTNNQNYIDSVNKGRSKFLVGENNYTSKLSETEVLAIIEECASSNITYAKLSKKYNISQATIFGILNNKIWKYINGKKSKKNSPLPYGENHKISKLTDIKVLEIRKKYSIGKGTCKELAIEYNVSNVTINRIIQNRIWRHLLSQEEKDSNTSPYSIYNMPLGKFNEDIVLEIREQYHKGGTSSLKLAVKYNASKKAILDIINYKTWKHIHQKT